MKVRKTLTAFSALAFALGAGAAVAQDGDDGTDDLELTMTLMPEDAELPDAVTRELELPRYAEGENEGEYIPSAQGVEHGTQGLDTANLAREDGRAFGEAAREAAQDNREEFGQGERPDLDDVLPDQVPDDHTPDLPEPPAGPPDGTPSGP